MKVFVLLLLMFLVFFAGSVLYGKQEAIILVVHFLFLYCLYQSGEYFKRQLNRIFFTFPPDAHPAFIKHGERLKNITILLVLGASGFGVYSLFVSLLKMDVAYVEYMRELIIRNYSSTIKIVLVLSVAYYLLLVCSVFAIYIHSFCIRLSLNYAPATPSNTRILEELDAKMKKYLPFKGE